MKKTALAISAAFFLTIVFGYAAAKPRIAPPPFRTGAPKPAKKKEPKPSKEK
jgi:hypothetical protein